MMEAACTSEISVNIQLRTQQYIPEDSELHPYKVTVVHVLQPHDTASKVSICNWFL
jgi:hypothetical protein